MNRNLCTFRSPNSISRDLRSKLHPKLILYMLSCCRCTYSKASIQQLCPKLGSFSTFFIITCGDAMKQQKTKF